MNITVTVVFLSIFHCPYVLLPQSLPQRGIFRIGKLLFHHSITFLELRQRVGYSDCCTRDDVATQNATCKKHCLSEVLISGSARSLSLTRTLSVKIAPAQLWSQLTPFTT